MGCCLNILFACVLFVIVCVPRRGEFLFELSPLICRLFMWLLLSIFIFRKWLLLWIVRIDSSLLFFSHKTKMYIPMLIAFLLLGFICFGDSFRINTSFLSFCPLSTYTSLSTLCRNFSSRSPYNFSSLCLLVLLYYIEKV